MRPFDPGLGRGARSPSSSNGLSAGAPAGRSIYGFAELARPRRVGFVALLTLLCLACGGGASAGLTTADVPAADPAAVREYLAGVRILERTGGNQDARDR